MASGDDGGSEGLSWESISRSLRRGSERFLSDFGGRLKKETGLDAGAAGEAARKLADGATEAVRETVDLVRVELVPRFVDWNKWEMWKVCSVPFQCLR